MALTPVRWVTAAIACCVIGAAILLQPPRRQPTGTDSARVVLAVADRRTHNDASAAAGLLRIYHLRDSMTSVVARAPRSDTQRVFVDPSLPSPLAREIRVLVARAAAFRPSAPKHRVDIAFLTDTLKTLRGVTPKPFGLASAEYVLPAHATAPCMVLVRIRPEHLARMNASALRAVVVHDETARKLLGPCAFYEWFGTPGPRVADWLGRGGWSYGLFGAWQEPPTEWPAPDWWGTVTEETSSGWPLRYYVAVSALRCITGDAVQCRRQVLRLEDAATHATPVLSPHIVTSANFFQRSFLRGRDKALGPMESALLGAMAFALGPDRFQGFWSSPLPPAEAFERAAGQEIGAWTLEWARRTYGTHGRGPAVHRSAIAIGLVVVAGALFLTRLLAQRRQTV